MDDQDQDDLLRRLLKRDAAAPSQFCDHFLPLLCDDRGWSMGITNDDHLIVSAAIDAMSSFVKRPEQYNPAKLSILSYLRMSAKGDLLNAIKKDQRHAKRRVPLNDVELHPSAGNDPQELREPPHGISYELLRRRLLKEFPDPNDRRAVPLILDGVRKTDAYAPLYELEHLPPDRRRRAVNKIKDRLKKKLRRLGARLDAEQG